MRIAVPDWTALALFAGMILIQAVYALAALGHFPSEHRQDALRGPVGTAVLWGSMVIVIATAALAARFAWATLPGYASVMAAGSALLVAPLVLKPLPDRLLDGRSGLLLFAGLAAGLAVVATRI